jgi:hypothetical protein
VATYFNNERIESRRARGKIEANLPTPLADGEGYLRNLDRDTTIKLFLPLIDEKPWLYEMGIPVMELEDDKWHVDVQQKVPLSRDRDNVTPAYLRKVRAAVLNAKVDDLTEEDSTAGWVAAAAGAPEANDAALKTLVHKRWGGKEVVLPDRNDPGATNEATSKGAVVLNNAVTGGFRQRLKGLKDEAGKPLVALASKKYGTRCKGGLGEEIPEDQWAPEVRQYVQFIERVAPKLIDQHVHVRVIDEEGADFRGCMKWQSGTMTVNLGYHDSGDQQENYELFLHEMAHAYVHNNDHLADRFYHTVTELGAKLAILALNEPELFDSATDNLSSYLLVQPFPMPFDQAVKASRSRGKQSILAQ